MKRFVALAMLLSLVLTASALSVELDESITGNLSSMPLAFTANQGQWDEQVRFRADAGGATMWFSTDGAYYQFTRRSESNEEPLDQIDSLLDPLDPEPDSIETLMIKASFVGANLNPPMNGENLLDYKCNYFIGSDPTGWHTDVANYSAVIYEEVYAGIDLKYYGNGSEMEYDFIVSPGADHSQIKIQYEGVESVSVNSDGELVVTTPWGEVIERRPVAYQLAADTRVPIEGQYRLMEGNAFGFAVGAEYDPTLPLIIDPVLSYSTYLGGSESDNGWDITVDGLGNAYITGYASSTDFPIEGEYQTYQGGGSDAFVTKLTSSGNSLVYSTYLGGSSHEYGTSIAVDSSGNAYICGVTDSDDFPTEGEYQTYGGNNDVFVAKLNSSGNALVYSTYLGGSSWDHSEGIAVDGFGNAYVVGQTYSPDFPVVGEYQTHQGKNDVFVTKLNSAGNALVYSTYLGGSDRDCGYGIALDGFGNAYITGDTRSSDFPTEGEYQTYQGSGDVFVAKLSSSGHALVYSTYLGGSDNDRCEDIAVDGLGNAYVAGWTRCADFPTVNAYQETLHGSCDAFVTKLNSTGNAPIYSTYLGGSGYETGNGIAVDGSGNAYIAGETDSPDFPVLEELQTYQGGWADAFVTKLNSSGDALVYSTYLGGSGYEGGGGTSIGIAIDGLGNAYITGFTYSADFPTVNAYQETLHGRCDAFVAKLLGEEPVLFCSIGGQVVADGVGASGIIVDVFGNDGTLLESMLTDDDGSYEFVDLPSGEDYTVTIVTPLGFEADEKEILVSDCCGDVIDVDFTLTPLETVGRPRGIGYWKHEVGVALGGAGRADLTPDQLCGFLDMIENHFNSNEINQVILYDPPESDFCTDKLAVASELLNLVGKVGLRIRAQQNLMALLFNVAAGHIFQQDVISADSATVSQAITYCDNVIDDPEGDHNLVIYICNELNHSRTLDAGMIPLNTLNILYKQLPLTFSLAQNYPNPFNPTTEISFSAPHTCQVKLEVFNIAGQRIQTLVNRQMEAGHHTVSFDGSKVASGVYLYRLEAGDFVESKKMMLVK